MVLKKNYLSCDTLSRIKSYIIFQKVEYMASLEGANEVVCLQGLVNELGIEQETVQLNGESEGAFTFG